MSGPDDFATALRSRLDELSSSGGRLDLWWRDDDAVAPTAALDRLLDARRSHGVPLALAVIPEPAGPDLAARLAGERLDAAVIQHGFAHRNHAPAGEKAAEFGPHRPSAVMLEELSRGRRRLEALFADRFLPVLTPPWNRVAADVAARRREAGLVGLSTFAAMHPGDRDCVNTHIDIVDWKGGRRFAGYAKMTAVLDEEIARRGAARPAPLGLLTHHLDHDEEAWRFLETLLSVVGSHPAVRWRALPELFGIAAGP